MIDLVHITNNLPLALGPINIVSNTHGPNMTLMLRMWKRLSQWICSIIICRYFAYLDISSLNDFSNEMIAPEYVFGYLM